MSSGVNPFIYDRTFSVFREAPTGTVGGDTDDYGGSNRATERLVVANIPASIQHNSTTAPSAALLPGQAGSRGRYRFHVPRGFLSPKTVLQDDVLVDDDGFRYIVNTAYRHAMGWRIEADTAEV
jgi:hypothetical protein